MNGTLALTFSLGLNDTIQGDREAWGIWGGCPEEDLTSEALNSVHNLRDCQGLLGGSVG